MQTLRPRRRALLGRDAPCAEGRHCTGCREEEALDALVQHAMDAGVPATEADRIVRATLPSYLKLLSAARWVGEGGSLTGSDPGPASVQQLRRAFAHAGFLSEPRCAGCGENRPLRHRSEAGRLCSYCYQLANAEVCAGCRRRRPVAWRDESGQAYCPECRRHSDEAAKLCSVCSKPAAVAAVTAAGPIGFCCYKTPEQECVGCLQRRPVWSNTPDGPQCRSCFRKPLETCRRCGELRHIPQRRTAGRNGWCVPCCRVPLADGDPGALQPATGCIACGREGKIQAYLPDGPRCGTCYGRALSRREPCSGCGDVRRVFFDPGVCADCLGIDIGHVCEDCGVEDNLYSAGRCVRCELAVRVDARFVASGPAAAVAQRIKASSSPGSTLRWLEESSSAALLVELLNDESVPTHEILDTWPSERQIDGYINGRRAVDYARALLIAAEVLPPRHDLEARFARWADDVLDAVASPSERWIVRRFVRERLLPTVAFHDETGKATAGTLRWAQARARAAVAFMAWLRPHGGLDALRPQLLDQWLAGPTSRHLVRDFVIWTGREKLSRMTRKDVPRREVRGAPEYTDHDARAAIARELLHGDGIPPDVRVAGLLVVLYGQHLSRIVGLRRDHVQLDPPSILLGKDALEMPEPLASHLRDALDSTGRGVLASGGSRWLFPGIRPGEHLSESALTERLRPYGIDARTVRNGALFHLAAVLQPHTLYRLLGLHPNTAVHWGRVAGSVYGAYWEHLIEDAEEDLDAEIDDAEIDEAEHDDETDAHAERILDELDLPEEPTEEFT